ncbi:MAG TPA: ABC transporter ATP-binding protein [Opitutaceae bacterium]|nr:ABC transporter ATP-binding protein [Opitutaceae bacterium]
MISIRVQHLTKRFGPTVALKNLSLTIEKGELFFLLGPSGCGKTTLLRTLAGFFFPDEGQVFFGDEDVSHLEPHRRQTGMMFQSYALWPHMTVAQNVAFGLEERKVPKDQIKQRVAEALAAVRMEQYAQRSPNQLSGGQQQRVALARALVIRPRCLLLDEPLSNLDAKLRLEMRTEIRRVCKEHNLTTVYVTHDQKEALSISDRMAILDAGQVLQVGTAREVYRRPHCSKVAHFIGEADAITGKVLRVEGESAAVETPIGVFEGILGNVAKPPAIGADVQLAIRPECWKLSTEKKSINSVAGRIGAATYLGEVAQYELVPTKRDDAPLKVLELNPKFLGVSGEKEIFATAAAEDVVVLVD